VTGARGAAHAALVRAAAATTHVDLSRDALPELDTLDERDRGLAYELIGGTLRRRITLDAVLREFSRIPLSSLDAEVREALRVSAYQLLYLDRVPAHAAVDEGVALVAPWGARSRGYVNAVLRRVAREGRARLAQLSDGEDDRSLSLRSSCPLWLVRLLRRDLGERTARAELEAANRPPERCLRVNPLRGSVSHARRVLAADGVATEPIDGCDHALRYSGAALERSRAFLDGLVTAQSRGSQLVAAVVAGGTREDAAIADLCAAPGMKTAQLAGLLPHARLLAVELSAERAEALRANLARLGVRGVDVRVGDALELEPKHDGTFDAVLLDAPCSGLGTLASRPDLRWHLKARDIARLATVQSRLLVRAAALVRDGGTLTFAVCTYTTAETVRPVAAVVAGGGFAVDDLSREHPAFAHPRAGGYLLTLPSRDGTSGFFVARLRRV
jgi:16S rRNA (cytosine967-C5)-methyltransferase